MCRWLYLSYNLIDGTIPPEIAHSPVSSVNLDHNQLTGTVPWQLLKSTTLRSAVLRSTKC